MFNIYTCVKYGLIVDYGCGISSVFDWSEEDRKSERGCEMLWLKINSAGGFGNKM